MHSARRHSKYRRLEANTNVRGVGAAKTSRVGGGADRACGDRPDYPT